MMTLVEASELTAPIFKSMIMKSSPVLQEKAVEIKRLFEGFKLTNSFRLNQFEILDEQKERAFRDLIALYEAELKLASSSA